MNNISEEVKTFIEPIAKGIQEVLEERDRSVLLVSKKEHEIADNVIRNLKRVVYDLEAVSHLKGSEVACIVTGLEKGMRHIYKENTDGQNEWDSCFVARVWRS